MTGSVGTTSSAIAPADQEGLYVDEDVVLLAVPHPPFDTLITDRMVDETLHSLEPPNGLADKVKKKAIEDDLEKPYEQIWKETEFEEKYLDHITSYNGPRKALEKIYSLSKKNDVCVVCGGPYEFSVRRIIYEFIQENGNG